MSCADPLRILDPMPFGKYRGELIGSIIEDDAEYMTWAINNTALRIDTEALRYLKENGGAA